jgi:hypothetical protein
MNRSYTPLATSLFADWLSELPSSDVSETSATVWFLRQQTGGCAAVFPLAFFLGGKLWPVLKKQI